MNLELSEKNVLISGATGGIGNAIVKDFLLEDATVICLIRNEDKMKTFRNDLENQGISIDRLHYYVCDLVDTRSLKEQHALIKNKFEKIDVLVNCAGAAEEYPFAIQEFEQIDRMVDLNLKSPMFLTKLILRGMFKHRNGSIINISSVSAVKKGRGIVSYAAAKAGIETFSRVLAIEVGRKGIRVNCIRPGLIETKMSQALRDRVDVLLKSSVSLERFGYPKEISKAVLFLASDKTASYITGGCITIDGGIF